MRQRKFKVWDINKKVFIPNDVYGIIATDFGAFGVMLKDWEDYREGEYFYEYAQTLIQFTGLKDKNGKEVYEDDLLRTPEGDIYRVWVEPGVILYGGVNKEWDDYLRRAWVDAHEVIGNIYEHPHLLNSDSLNNYGEEYYDSNYDKYGKFSSKGAGNADDKINEP